MCHLENDWTGCPLQFATDLFSMSSSITEMHVVVTNCFLQKTFKRNKSKKDS